MTSSPATESALPEAESVDCAHRQQQEDYKIVAIYRDPQDAATVVDFLKRRPPVSSPPTGAWHDIASADLSTNVDTAAMSTNVDTIRSEALEEAALKLDAKADLYREYAKRAARENDMHKSALMDGHAMTVWDAAKTVRSLKEGK